MHKFARSLLAVVILGGLGATHADVEGIEEAPAGPRGIYLYDLQTRTARTLASGAGRYGLPRISGRYVVWTEGPSGPYDLRLHDLTEGTTQSLVPDRRVQQPDVDGHRVIWYELGVGLDSAIHVYDIGTRRIVEVVKTSLVYGGPVLRGDLMIWADYNQGQGDIFVHDFRTRQSRQITRQDPSEAGTYRVATKHLDFDGSRIVWIASTTSTRDAEATSSLAVYDVADGTQTAIPLPKFTYTEVAIAGEWLISGGRRQPLWVTQLPAGPPRPLLEGREVVSVELDGTKLICEVLVKGEGRLANDILLIDVTTGAVTPITDTPSMDRAPDIDGDRVVWMVE